MSYTHLIRACLASAHFDIPAAVQQHLDGLDKALWAGLDVIHSASNEGCSGELTVIDAEKLKEFADLSNAVRTDDIGQPANVPEAKVELVLSIHDADNCVVDSASAELTIKQVEHIVDVASSLVLAHRNGQDTDEFVEQLDLELCRADVLASAQEQDSAERAIEWTAQNDSAASKEGWNIFETTGSSSEKWQVQRIDFPEDREPLANESDAWELVYSGTDAHHVAARAFIQHHNPEEWAEIVKHCESVS
jgi:hypothetical protein